MSKPVKVKFYPSAMTIAGSDSGGGAGIAADLRTFNAFGVFGTCAITAVTAQNPAAVRQICLMDAQTVTDQIDAVREKIPVKYVKTGMLGSAQTVHAVAQAVKKYNFKLICDPVMISTSGSKLLADDAAAVMQTGLFPLAAWITPNIPEAEFLTGSKITSVNAMLDAATALQQKYQAAVWLKGGHLSGNAAVDVIVKDGKRFTLSSPLLDLRPLTTHGTGCTLSAALTAMLALEMPWKQAVCAAKAFVFGSLEQCVDLGPGIQAMYPATEDFIQLIKLAEAEK